MRPSTGFTFVLALCFASLSRGADFDPYHGPRPIAVVVEWSPFNHAAPTPLVAVYENGLFIFRMYERYAADDPRIQRGHGRTVHRHATLNKAQLSELCAEFEPVLKLPGLRAEYDLDIAADDLPNTHLYVRHGGRQVATSVFGLASYIHEERRKADDSSHDDASLEEPPVRKPSYPPAALLKLHERLCGLGDAGSKEWTPKYLEVSLWPYGGDPANHPAPLWPKDWPTADSQRCRKTGDSYSVYLDYSKWDEVGDLLSKRWAFVFAGQQMGAGRRVVFPGEPVWQKAFDESYAREEQAKTGRGMTTQASVSTKSFQAGRACRPRAGWLRRIFSLRKG